MRPNWTERLFFISIISFAIGMFFHSVLDKTEWFCASCYPWISAPIILAVLGGFIGAWVGVIGIVVKGNKI